MAFAFVPPTGYRDTVSFPTKPANETVFRDSMQTLLDQMADYVNSSNVFTSSNSPLTANYQKLASGLIIQWGTISVPSAGASLTFPIAFPTTTGTVALTLEDTNFARSTILNITTSSVSIIQDSGATKTFRWFAIGY